MLVNPIVRNAPMRFEIGLRQQLVGSTRHLTGGWGWLGALLSATFLLVLPDLGVVLAGLLAAAFNIRVWRAHPLHPLRPTWLLTGLSMAAIGAYHALDRAGYLGLEILQRQTPLLLVGSFVCLIVGLVIRLRRMGGAGLRLTAALDALTITLAAAALELWLFWPLTPGAAIETVHIWLSPMVTHLLALGVLYLAYQPSAARRTLTVALILWAVLSIVTGWLAALIGFGLLAWPPSIVYLFGGLAMLANAWAAHIEQRTANWIVSLGPRAPVAFPIQVLPYFLIGLGTALVIAHGVTILSLPLVLVGLCALLVLIRQWVVVRENARLLAELRASHTIIAQARDQAAQEARTDSLTGLPNRRFLYEHLLPLLAYHRRSGLPLSVAFLDIDFFKAVNDRLGHAAGDQALISIGQILSETLREGDILARYGGEEFVILLPDTTEHQAFNVADRLRLAIAARPMRVGDDRTAAVTVSLGVATYPAHGETAEEILQAADQALYAAKAAGRDRVATPVASGQWSVASRQ